MKRLCSLLLAFVMVISVGVSADLSASAVSVTGDQIVAEARRHVGKSYVSGAAGPDSFDCSGLTMYVFAKFGISLPHSTYEIYNNPSKYGTVIATDSYTNALPGDLICWYGHIGIYTGIYNYNGTQRGFLVDAANTAKGVVEQPIWPSNGSYKVVRVYEISTTPAQQGNMTVPKITLDKSEYSVAQTVNITWTKTEAETDFRCYKITITNTLTGEEIYSGTTTEQDVTKNSYNFKVTVPGTYSICVYAIPYNSPSTRQRSASKSISVGGQVNSVDDLKKKVLIENEEDPFAEDYYEIIDYSGWVYDKDGNVYFAINNTLAKGWLRYSYRWYYFSPKTGIMQKGWLKNKNNWYYLSYGVMQKGWCKVNNKWYYMADSGAMQTGWQQINGVWYYLNMSGAMQTGWKKLGNYWYHFETSGRMSTGWKKINNKWYYLIPSSGRMKTGWLKLDGLWYYLNEDGSMRTDDLEYKGKTYMFDHTGICLNP